MSAFRINNNKNYILKQCSVEFRAGEIVTVVGKTGSGKTTLMNLLNRFIDPTEGQVLIGSEQMGWTNIKDLSYLNYDIWFRSFLKKISFLVAHWQIT